MDANSQASPGAPAQPRRHPASWAYPMWFVVGALFGFGVVSLLTVGILFIAAASLLGGLTAALTVARSRARGTAGDDFRPAIAIPAGLALPVFYLAWLNRDGPGEVCDALGCTERWSPWPFVIVASGLVAGTLVLARVMRSPRRPVQHGD